MNKNRTYKNKGRYKANGSKRNVLELINTKHNVPSWEERLCLTKRSNCGNKNGKLKSMLKYGK